MSDHGIYSLAEALNRLEEVEAERDTLREALERIAGYSPASAVNAPRGWQACENIARATLTQGAGEEQERKAREEAEFEVRRRQRSNGWRNV